MYLFYIFFFDDTLSINILFGSDISGYFSSFLKIQSNASWLNILINRTTLAVYSVSKGSFIADWLLENMNSDMSPNRLTWKTN